MRYRFKSILSDGRRVYHSKRGEVEYYSEKEKASVNPSVALSMEYSPNLFIYASPGLLRDAVRIGAIVWERESDPIDDGAYPVCINKQGVRTA